MATHSAFSIDRVKRTVQLPGLPAEANDMKMLMASLQGGEAVEPWVLVPVMTKSSSASLRLKTKYLARESRSDQTRYVVF
ncbi:uncharacterized protein PHALS_14159 [Plasmopara halstedii]|uniref:Uncharacterized protein n=1 Tax=Plasmopara halstedii TaxID=4781 RepID=A0A0P1AR32_PLAHL|nr:uncharacterized protein PHALS_14159 [Plasmopara halstedii]CEG43872.1 hypothetical protein PHALS_14159 [Plasmopara halstedii]|eukprot:XP_024580241.1 hypothetical protein PHALS_14159 [Plasmopara halstedii]